MRPSSPGIEIPHANKTCLLVEKVLFHMCYIFYVHAYRVINAYDYMYNMYVCNLIYQCKQIYVNVNK